MLPGYKCGQKPGWTLALILGFVAVICGVLYGQDSVIVVTKNGALPALAVPDFKGTGAQQLMGAFNSTLYSDLQNSGCFELRPKSFYPLDNPQSPQDLRPADSGAGRALQDWSGAPVNASHLVFGYGAAQNGTLVVLGNVYDTRQPIQSAALIGPQRYVGSLDEAGAVHVAHEFSNDIISKFGCGSLLGSRIYYVSSRGAGQGNSEIWAMDWDGQNQKQLTHLGTLSEFPAISPDGSRLAFTSWYPAGSLPKILMIDTSTGRRFSFYNQEASLNANASFTPDGKNIFYVSTAAGVPQIFEASITGEGYRRISHSNSIESEPKVNPRNGNLLLFTSGKSGAEQIYKMNADGTGVERVSDGTGEASNPAWSPDGHHIAFAWTRGYARGDFNIFVTDIASPSQYVQLTHSEGRNENPVWAPDGAHIVFASTRGGRLSQIYTMLANGTQVTQLTREGNNKTPVWGVK